MAEMVAVAFENPDQAEAVLDELRRLQQQYLIGLEDAVIAVRQPDGEVKLKQSVNLVGLVQHPRNSFTYQGSRYGASRVVTSSAVCLRSAAGAGNGSHRPV